MNIYISHSTSFDFKNELYKPLRETTFTDTFILPHETSDLQYPVKELFDAKKCNMVIAEVSFPSTGQGIELGWANDRGISIVCFYKKGSVYSRSLTTISDTFIEYTNSADLLEKIKKLL